MPEKIDPYRSYGQKLISLFAKLLFSRQSHSLIELSRMLNCSKQTVLRLVEDIRRSYGVNIEEMMEGRRKYFQIKRLSGITPALSLTYTEISVLQMCHAFAEHLLGRQLFEEATRALEKGQALLPEGKRVSFRHFASFHPGSIDYTPHQETIRRLIEAMEKRKTCQVTYRAIMEKRAKTFYIKPLKIFSHHDTVYLHARMARTPGKPFREPDFDPLLAVHRIKKVELTDRMFKFPADYDFEKVFNRNFGIIKEDSFEVQAEFTGWAARYVTERIWSPDQKVIEKKRGKIRLIFTASSEPELISWLLSFDDEAKLLKPDWLVEEVRERVNRMAGIYVA